MDIRGSERFFPIIRTTFAQVSQDLRSRRHPLLKLRGEAVEGTFWNAERPQSLKAKRNTYPSVTGRAGRMSRGRYNHTQATHQFASRIEIVNAEDDVGRREWSGARTQDSALNVIEFKNRHVHLRRNSGNGPVFQRTPAGATHRTPRTCRHSCKSA